MKREVFLVLCAACLAFAWACGSGGSAGPDTGTAPDTPVPADAPGDLHGADVQPDPGGIPVDGAVTFRFPPGIDPDPMGITVTPASNAPRDPLLVPGTAFDFGPDGLEFGDTVFLVIAYDPAALAGTMPRSSLRLARVVDGAWQVVPASGCLRDEDAVVGPISGFSTYGVLSTGEPASLDEPQIDEIHPAQGQPGDPLTVRGVYLDREPRQLQVVFGRADNTATPASRTDFRAEVQVPAAIPASSLPRLLPVRLVNGTKQGDARWFTLWEVPPEPPMITAVQPQVGSPGDPVRINAVRVAPTAEGNRVRFNGVEATVESVEFIAWTGDTYRLNVRVPTGATTGPVQVGRVADDAWSGGVDFTVQDAAAPTLDAGWETGPVRVPCTFFHRGRPDQWSSCTPSTLVLGGSGFHSLRYRPIASEYPRGFYGQLLVRFTAADGTSVTLLGSALADDLLLVDPYGPDIGPQGQSTPQDFFQRRAPGEVVRVLAWGKELQSQNERFTNAIDLVVGEPLVHGAVRSLGTSLVTQPATDAMDAAVGDHLCLEGQGTYPFEMLEAPGLWTGALPFAKYVPGDYPQALTGRCFPLDAPGDLVVRNRSTQRSYTIRVLREGMPAVVRTPTIEADPGGDPDLVRDGLFMGFGGGRITIPPGALPAHDEGDGRYRVEVHHAPGAVEPFDPNQFDGGHRFSLEITPEPPVLLEPITLDLPFDPAAHREAPEFGVYDESSGLFWAFASEVDADRGRIRFRIPAGLYDGDGTAGARMTSGDAGIHRAPLQPLPRLGLNLMFRHFGLFSGWYSHSTIGDTDQHFLVNYINDPASPHHISNAAADEIVDLLLQSRQVLMGANLREPEFTVHVHVRDYGDPGAYYGATERRLFGLGDPVVYYNSRIVPDRAKFRTTVAHELVHVFQRLVTTTWTTHWIDEATAEWGAFATVGADDFHAYAMRRSVPWIREFPGSLRSGLDEEESYAAGAFGIWLAWHYDAGTIGDIYDLLILQPTRWYDAPGTLGEVTGDVFPSLYAAFARDFWSQAFPPVDRLDLDGAMAACTGTTPARLDLDAAGARIDAQRPARSSVRQGIRTTDAFATAAQGRDLVVRLAAGADSGDAHVFRDPSCSTTPPVSFPHAAWLKADTPNRLLGKVGESACYQVVVINWSQAATRMAVEVVAPTITGLSPPQGSNAGGYAVTIPGRGFGATPGTVTIGGFPLAPTSWSDTSISVTMPDMGTALGAWIIAVTTAEQAATNPATFTFVARP